jgi:hypothetical protein
MKCAPYRDGHVLGDGMHTAKGTTKDHARKKKTGSCMLETAKVRV